ncbi:MAG: deoxynucleoside kinase [Betaproteobacteria bacterium CG2_30_59_46]|nr:MAG: deoxynucleoside kinase [Betaproteobacteria bacterium CG2_30_59_46]PIQ13644.1 MAG: deoxynucleoside kinase [Hydrogenophilales bacterium CG18_big_fil_WC_8_21_14_2_50_58_12]PIY01233.1 MAG: deoxynucleoside kinase [Hydrogenophilales bacterium CG_4_10_14_3_um_filter_58_23]PJB07805.1 MAG: deoxynucleoside kinase [Hydrogenophilales bacterium CG_4_9_14_3_um_filter_59_35]
MPDKYRYIAVEGPIGVGKTSLARRLSERFQAGLMLEDADSNPFLPRFYQDAARYALQTQLFFLFQRAAQVRDLKQLELFGQPTVSDFLLDKDTLFARLNLNDEEYRLYQQIFAHLQPQTPTPDLVIYLQAPVGSLIERVRRRGVAYESPITEDYLVRLAESYSRYFYQYDASPLLIVNSEHLNFADQPQDFELLLERIGQMRGGREFFNRAG